MKDKIIGLTLATTAIAILFSLGIVTPSKTLTQNQAVSAFEYQTLQIGSI